jgi:hypothetical protein
MKHCLFALVVLFCSMSCSARTPRIESGATVYIEPMGGYESYLASAFSKKHVPLIVVADKDKAEYIITSTVAVDDLPAKPASARIAMINAYQIVFAYASETEDTDHLQKTAEDCAKHLKEIIGKSRK